MMQDLTLILVFAVLVPVMLFIDLFVAGGSHKVSLKEASIWSGVWISVSLLFAGFIYVNQGPSKASEFLTAYVIEKALSVDNLFVFITIFAFFKVPDEYHHKVLLYGVLGAFVLRAIFIFTGVAIISHTYFTAWGMHISPLMIAFGAFLIYGGYKSLLAGDDDEEQDFSDSTGAKLINKLFGGRVSPSYDGNKLITRVPDPSRNGNFIKYATPLLVVIAVIEITDLLFATDSIPAVLVVSKDSFILYASNIFAILGLRAMYFLLANVMHLFRFLKYGLAIILSFIGLKMLIAPFYEISSPHSLAVVGGVLVTSITISLILKEKQETPIDTVVDTESEA